MDARGLDALVLLGLANVQYATGARTVAGDQGQAFLERVVAVVPAAGEPHLFTPWPEGAPPELAPSHVHPALVVDELDGVADLAGLVRDLSGGRATVGVDDQSPAMFVHLAGLLPGIELVDATPALSGARLVKTPDEIECIRTAQSINEAAMSEVRPRARPGVRQSELSAQFLRLVCELGAHANTIDPIWQVMAPSVAAGPFTTTGHVGYPVSTTDRLLREGDVIWVDTGINYLGYASDFGRTWIVADDPRPTARQRDQFLRWGEVMDRVIAVLRPGVTGADLTRAACEGLAEPPWLPHFYLGHGIGIDSAEMPLVGSDLGQAFDEGFVFGPGMVLVLEPVIWDDGQCGYRSEEVFVVSEDGCRQLSDHTYAPFE